MKKAKGNFDLLLKMKQSKKKVDKDVEEVEVDKDVEEVEVEEVEVEEVEVEEVEVDKDVEVDIESLSYRELQELAQENNIVANQKKPELIKELKEVL